tara:strand:+ start:368 stop:781 length:414 start_codon:yes stop_codon:yes gene_type:complete
MKISYRYVLLFLLSVVNGLAWEVGEDRTRLGERLLSHEIKFLNSAASLFSTIDTRDLSTRECSAIGRVFRVPPASIQKFRRGLSVAPTSHHLNQTHWYTVWFNSERSSDVQDLELRTLRVVDGVMVVEEKYWPRLGK